MAPATILETSQLLETVAGAVVAGVAITLAFCLCLLGLIRAPECWREQRYLQGSLYGVVAAVALAAAIAGTAYGLAIVAGDSPLG